MSEIINLNDPKIKEIVLNKIDELVQKKLANLKRRPYVGQTRLVTDIHQELKPAQNGFSASIVIETKRVVIFRKKNQPKTKENLFVRDELFSRIQPFQLDKQKLAFTRRANIFKFDKDFDKIIDEVAKYSADVALETFMTEI